MSSADSHVQRDLRAGAEPAPDGDPRAPGEGAEGHREPRDGRDGRLERTLAAVERGPAELLCGSPREVLARIVPGDPLGLRDVVADVLHRECVFLDADRVHLRALARTARAALRFAHSGEDLRAWLRGQATAAVAELLTEDLDAPRLDPTSAFVQFARPLRLDPEALRRGCAAFNRLPREDRAAFFALVVEETGLEAHARASGATPTEAGRRARRGLDAVLRAHHPDLPPAPRAGTRCDPASAPHAHAPAPAAPPTPARPALARPALARPVAREELR